jgi:hypothetical protein
MEIFEIHITGDERIIEAATQLNLKTIVIALLKPDNRIYDFARLPLHQL